MAGRAPTASPIISGSLEGRVQRMEWEREDMAKRLSEGAETFAEIRESIKDIHDELKPKPLPTWKIVSAAITILVLVGAWIWQAARYPDRTEFNEAQAASASKSDSVRNDVIHLKMEQVRIQADVKQIRDSQDRTEKQIDAIRSDLKTLSKRRR